MPGRGMTPEASRTLDRVLLVAAAGLTSAWCLVATRHLGATFDEPFYIESGLHFWRHLDPGPLLEAGTMPLAPEAQALPLRVVELVGGVPWVWAEQVAPMLGMARSVTLVFWWVLLAYVMRLGAAIGGAWAGRLALVLVAIEPNFLAHAGLATTDVPMAACLVAFVFHFRDGRDRRWGRRVGLPVVLFALTLVAKASAIVFGPVVMVLVEAERCYRAGGNRTGTVAQWLRDVRPFVRDACAIVAAGTVLAALLCGTGGDPSFQGTLARLPEEHWLRPVLAWFGALPLFPNGLYALWFQVDHAVTGQAVYVAGVEASRSLWFYVPALLLIKLPIPILLIGLAAALIPRPRLAGLAGVAVVVIGLMALVRVQTGIRFALPLLAPIIVVCAARLTGWLAGLERTGRRVCLTALAVLIAWLMAGDVRAWPDTIRYTNELAGDTEEGYRFVSDSNYDWGQGLPELAAWQSGHGGPIAVWYFGTDPRYPTLQRFNPRHDDSTRPDTRYLAVSASLLYGGYLVTPGPARDLMLQLRSRRPVARTSTFFIFDEDAYGP